MPSVYSLPLATTRTFSTSTKRMELDLALNIHMAFIGFYPWDILSTNFEVLFSKIELIFFEMASC